MHACPAKINLSLAVHGLGPCGQFHNVLSLTAALALQDALNISIHKNGPKNENAGMRKSSDAGSTLTLQDTLSITGPISVPTGPENLILKAFALIKKTTGAGNIFFNAQLVKKIPHGAGLGGGSSNAATALKQANILLGSPLNKRALHSLAAQLGSDVALFLQHTPCIVSGRGERTQHLLPHNKNNNDNAIHQTHAQYIYPKWLRGEAGNEPIPILLAKPSFGIATPAAYAALKQQQAYTPASAAQANLNALLNAPSAAKALPYIHNNFEAPTFNKYIPLGTAAAYIKANFNTPLHLSGSGSACFILGTPESAAHFEAIEAYLKNAWGPETWCVRTHIQAPTAKET